jgi:hypothetical protein
MHTSCVFSRFTTAVTGTVVLQEPLLLTAVRTRPSHFKPRELREEEELASIPKFHARPLK